MEADDAGTPGTSADPVPADPQVVDEGMDQ